MASTTKSCVRVPTTFCTGPQKIRQSRPRPSACRSPINVRSQQKGDTVAGLSRREASIAGLSVALGLVINFPAQAFLGFGEPSKEEVYKSETADMITSVRSVISLEKEDPNKESTVLAVRKQTNNWVAKYRRDNSFGGRPSYGATYTALNALAGHYNSFGSTAPLPKKRLERINKELDDAEKMLARGR